MDVSVEHHFGDEASFRIDEPVVHIEHGIGLLRGIETIAAADPELGEDTLRLEYAGGTMLMLPVHEINFLWSYGAASAPLDRLGGESWSKRRAEILQEIEATAKQLLALAEAREAQIAPKLAAPVREYERFAAGFHYPLTADQERAIGEVLDDLGSGHPMDRLLCGEVGFGKTEVALRVAAAAALAGKQVAVVVPTTVLARQHFGTFRRRFAPFGIEVQLLTRFVKPADARLVKEGLRNGTVRVVIGTHAVASRGVHFKDLGLLIIDEEQRFGSALKQKLRDFGKGLHVLAMSATPIPRTLQRALAGLQTLSTLESPPARRLAPRTVLTRFGPALIRDVLLYEKNRGGQSFLVCPRIEDLEPMAQQLRQTMPGLRVVTTHGKLPPAEVDEAVVSFAEGRGDVLLTTNIIETGLDIPRANTILIWRPDRFGTAQLHQLRGRVGRGRRRGLAYLLTDPETELPGATQARLQALTELSQLGAGFAVSRRDLDLRGAGDLLGPEQTGHIRQIGLDLYRHLLHRALSQARSRQTGKRRNRASAPGYSRRNSGGLRQRPGSTHQSVCQACPHGHAGADRGVRGRAGGSFRGSADRHQKPARFSAGGNVGGRHRHCSDRCRPGRGCIYVPSGSAQRRPRLCEND
jgi:transcription-repair coupling factor (superfamily II helicase)